MRKLLFLLALALPLAAQNVTITSDTQPPGVSLGGTHAFTCANCPAVVWSVACQGTSCQAGSIDASGNYTAPATTSGIRPGSSDRGCQLGPLNNAYDLSIAGASVHSNSAYWMSRIANEQGSWTFHRFPMNPPGTPNLYDNVVTNSSPLTPVHAYYHQDLTNFSQPLPPNVIMESGWSQDRWAQWLGELDQHIFAVNSGTCDDQEVYKEFADFKTFSIVAGNPTVINFTSDFSARTWQNPMRMWIFGSTDCTAINAPWLATVVSQTQITIPFNSTGCHLAGAHPTAYSLDCQTCNMAGAADWPANSNAIEYGVDAAGTPMSREAVHNEKLWMRVQNNITDPNCTGVCGGNSVTLGHAIGTTMDNGAIAPADLWPSINGHLVTEPHPQLAMNCFSGASCVSNANPAVVTMVPCDGQSCLAFFQACIGTNTWTPCSVGNTFQIVFGGGTGSWAALNGQHIVATVTGTGASATFTIPYDTRAWGTPNPGLYAYFDWIPYGAHFRLKSTFDNTTVCNNSSLANWCPYAWAILNTLKVYGMVLVDGSAPSDNWDTRTVNYEFYPDQLQDAIYNLAHSPAFGFNPNWPTGGGIEQYFDIVDVSGSQVYTCDYGQPGCTTFNSYIGTTNQNNRVTVTATSSGHGSQSIDVNLQATSVSCDKGKIVIPTSGSYQLNCWVNGNTDTGLTYTGSAYVSNTGLITAPSSLSPSQTTENRINICSHADPLVCGYTDVFLVPVSPDTSIRLWLGGQDLSYTDTNSKQWFGQITPRAWDSSYENNGAGIATLLGTWTTNGANWTANGVVDPKLYGEGVNSVNDIGIPVALANGSYTVTIYGEPGYGVNQLASSCAALGTFPCAVNVYDVEINGQVVSSYNDALALAGGLYKGYQSTYNATVSNGLLQLYIRGREQDTSGEGESISSVIITPGNSPLSITTVSLPNGNMGTAYDQTPAATGGVPPYTWSIVSGSLPAGLTLNSSTGEISGTPTTQGTSSFTLEVTDSVNSTATQSLSITINPQAVSWVTRSLPGGSTNTFYSAALQCQGGVPPYTFVSTFGGVPGLSVVGSNYQGTPSTLGTFIVSLKCTDTMSSFSTRVFSGIKIQAGQQNSSRITIQGHTVISGATRIQ